MSTYLNHGGAARERILAELWGEIELRVERREAVSIEHLRLGLRCRDHGWNEDELSLVSALSGHAYGKVMLVVEAIAQDVDGHAGVPDTKLHELRTAYALLRASRVLVEELAERGDARLGLDA